MKKNLGWNEYFLLIAQTVSRKSHCLSVQRGCVIVRGKQIVSTGYNGPPSGFPHCSDLVWRNILAIRYGLGNGYQTFFTNLDICPRRIMGLESGEGLEYCPAIHAETNSIVQAAKNGISVEGTTLYCAFSEVPCRECAKLIIGSGIARIVLMGKPTVYPEKGILGYNLLKDAGIEIKSEEEKECQK